MILCLLFDTSAHMNQLISTGQCMFTICQEIAIHFLSISKELIQVVLFTGETKDIIHFLTAEEAIKKIRQLQATGRTETSCLIRNAINTMHEYLLSQECDTFGHGRFRQLSIPISYFLFSSARALQSINSDWDFKGKERLLSPFRWDSQFNAFIIYKPVYYNNTNLDVKNSSLNTLCDATNGKLMVIDSVASCIKNCTYFFSSIDRNNISSNIFSLYPTILIRVEKTDYQEDGNSSIPIPLIPSLDTPSYQQSFQTVFQSNPPCSFYPYPEQKGKRDMFPLFYLRCIDEQYTSEQLLVMLKKYSLPYDEVVVPSREISEVYKLSTEWFMNELPNYTRQGKPYLFGEDHHCYATITNIQKDQFTLLFFPPDFPYFLTLLDMKNSKGIITWIQTIPLEYVTMIYSCLQKLSFQFPFPCPPLPSREQCNLAHDISIHVLN